jgi:hypothetical protein
MLVRWTAGAADDLERITDYLFDERRSQGCAGYPVTLQRHFCSPTAAVPTRNLERASWLSGRFLISWSIMSAAMWFMSRESCTGHKSGRINLP